MVAEDASSLLSTYDAMWWRIRCGPMLRTRGAARRVALVRPDFYGV
jgi:hypothetical protein